MRRVLGLWVLLVAAPVAFVHAQDVTWPADAQGQLALAATGLAEAVGPGDRLAAFSAVQDALQDAGDAPGASVMLRLAGAQIGGELAVSELERAVAALAKATAPEVLEEQAAIIIGAMAALKIDDPDAEPVLPSTMIALSDAVQDYDDAAAAVGLPSLRDSVLNLLPEGVRDRVSGLLDRIDTAAEIARDLEDLAAGDDQAAERVAEAYFELFPTPALAGQQVAIVDLIDWNNRMYGASANALQEVAAGIETGQVNTAAINNIMNELRDLSRGPWGLDTMRDVLSGLCGDLPVLADLCDAVAGAVLQDPALAIWEGTWSTGWGHWEISQGLGGLSITGTPGSFLERWEIAFTVTSASANEIRGTYFNATFEVEGTFAFQLESDGRSFIGELTGEDARVMTGTKL